MVSKDVSREELRDKLEYHLRKLLKQKQYQKLSVGDLMAVLGKVMRNGGR